MALFFLGSPLAAEGTHEWTSRKAPQQEFFQHSSRSDGMRRVARECNAPLRAWILPKMQISAEHQR